MTDTLPALIWTCGADGNAILFNKAWLQFTGRTLDECLGRGWTLSVHPDDLGGRLAAQENAVKYRLPFEAEFRLKRADGQYRRVLDQAAPQFGSKGQFRGYVGVTLDLTDRKQAEEKLCCLSRAVEQCPASVVITDLDGRIEYVNPKFTAVTGYAAEEVIGKNPSILKSGEMSPEQYTGLWDTITHGGEWHGEFHNRKKNGELYWEFASISPIRGDGGEVTHYLAVKEDITERKRMQDALRISENRFRIAAETAGDRIVEWDVRAGRVEAHAPGCHGYHQRSVQEWRELLHPDDQDRVLKQLNESIERREPFRAEYRIQLPDKQIRYMSEHAAPVQDDPWRWIATVRDISAEKHAEAALARLAAIVRYSTYAMVATDADGRIQSWNAAAEQLYGYSAEEMQGVPVRDLACPSFRDRARQRIEGTLRGESQPPHESRHVKKDGREFPVFVVGSPIKSPSGSITGLSVIIRDITQQALAQQALRISENRFRALIQSSSDSVTLMDPTGRVMYDNGALATNLGFRPEERIGQSVFDFIHAEDEAYARKLFSDLLGQYGSNVRAALRLRHRNGSWRWCDVAARNLLAEPGVWAIVANSRDITEQKAMEAALRESEQRYRRLVEDAADPIFAVDLKYRLTAVNAAGEKITGFSRDEVLGMDVRRLTAPEYLDTIQESIDARLGGADPGPLELELICREGKRIDVEVTGRLQFRNGQPVGMLCIARDVGERKRLDRLEHNRLEVLEMIAQNQPLEEILDRLVEMIEQYCPGTAASFPLDLGSAPGETTARRSIPHPPSIEHIAVPVRASDGQVLGALNVYRTQPRPVSKTEQVFFDSMAKLAAIALEHRQLTNLLAYQAQHDALTGLPNRMLLDDRLHQAIALARRQQSSVAVMYVDLDRFKLVNDTLGHAAGDALLKQAGVRLHNLFRESDTLARTGGDEFVAVVFGLENATEADFAGARIVEAMREPFEVDSHELFITASVGISLFPRDGDDATTLQKHADVAMYEAKSRGRDRYQRFSRQMLHTNERLETESHLHRALERNELVLHYQPQYHLPTGTLAGVEALLRWNHPKRGLVPPGEFIPLAEESGLVIPFSIWVLREACRQHQMWREHGFAPVKIAVNVSAIQFARSNLARSVAQILEEYGVEARYLELELTEGVVMRDIADSARQITDLRELGVSISIDDFGTGYSSLSYLQRLPMDDLKIDQSFVRGIEQPSTTQPLVKAIVGLAHSMKMTATAEGVETEKELAVLAALGCDKVQGYFLGKPASAERLADSWRARVYPVANNGNGTHVPLLTGLDTHGVV
ncbi:MAG: PAS domain S-box protein [Bryobacteraceae bacterium]